MDESFSRKLYRLENSSYGESLEKETRFGRFHPNFISNEYWEKLLGADVNNLRHMRLMYGFSKALLAKNTEISSSEKELIYITALVHDFAESIVSDIPDPLKTKESDDIEFFYLKNILAEFGISSEEILKVVSNKSDGLGRIWRQLEVAGYLRTAFISWQRSKSVSDEIKPIMEELTKSVFARNIEFIISESAEFPYLQHFLDLNESIIKEIREKFSI